MIAQPNITMVETHELPAAATVLIPFAVEFINDAGRPENTDDGRAYARIMKADNVTVVTGRLMNADGTAATASGSAKFPTAQGWVQYSVINGRFSAGIEEAFDDAIEELKLEVGYIEGTKRLQFSKAFRTEETTSGAAVMAALGVGTDAATAPGALGSVHSKLRRIAVETDKIGTPAGVSVSADAAAIKADTAALLLDTGDGTDAETAAGAAGSLHSKTRAILADTADMQPKLGAPAGASISADIAAVKVDSAAILVDTGDGTDVETAAGAAGSLHSKLNGILTDTADMQPKLGAPAGASMSADIAAVKSDTAAVLADTGDGTDAPVAAGLAGSLHGHVRSVQVDTTALLADTGDGTDAAVAPSVAGSLHAHIREIQENVDAVETDTQDIQTKIGAPAGASVSADVAAVKAETAAILVDTGDGTDVETAAGAAGSLHSKLRGILTDTADIQPKIGAPAGASVSADIAAVKADSAALLADTGDGTDAAVAAGLAGSLHAHVRHAQETLGAPAGASVSADVAAVKTETAALLLDTGDGADAATAGGAAGSLHSKLRRLITDLGTPEAALVSVAEQIGQGDDAAGSFGVAAESLHSKLRSLMEDMGALPNGTIGDDFGQVENDLLALLADTGDGTDAVVAAGVAGSLHGHIRDIQAKIGVPTVSLVQSLAEKAPALGAGTLDGATPHTNTLLYCSTLKATDYYSGERIIVKDLASGVPYASASRLILSYNTGTKEITLAAALPWVPVNGDTFYIVAP